MLSNASYVVGAGLAVGALATWLLWPKDATTGDLPSLGLLPEVGPAGGGLTAAGRF